MPKYAWGRRRRITTGHELHLFTFDPGFVLNDGSFYWFKDAFRGLILASGNMPFVDYPTLQGVNGLGFSTREYDALVNNNALDPLWGTVVGDDYCGIQLDFKEIGTAIVTPPDISQFSIAAVFNTAIGTRTFNIDMNKRATFNGGRSMVGFTVGWTGGSGGLWLPTPGGPEGNVVPAQSYLNPVNTWNRVELVWDHGQYKAIINGNVIFSNTPTDAAILHKSGGFKPVAANIVTVHSTSTTPSPEYYVFDNFRIVGK